MFPPLSCPAPLKRAGAGGLALATAMLIGWWLTPSASAQLLSLDINGTVRSDVTAPGFTAWYMAADLTALSNKQAVSRSFTNFAYTYDADTGLPTATNINLIIPCTVTMVNPATASGTNYLNANYANKNGNSTSSDPNAGYRLSADGCWAHWKDDALTIDQPWTNSGAMSLTLLSLPAGVHSITTYHNDLWPTNTAWHGTNLLSHCIISVNGTPVFTNTPSWLATNDSRCGFAFFYITNSYDGQPVVIDFTPDHSSVLDFVILNGFEIDRLSAPGTTATAIFPTAGDEHVAANNDTPLPSKSNAGYLNLQWQPAGFALTNYIYFGTSSNAVYNATPASGEYKGQSAATAGMTNSFSVTNLNSALTYYWRIDQLDVSNGATNVVKGYVWKFRTRHLAFPGAEGYGQWARGGRGGVVLEVTNLNDSGPGSYRAAIGASGPRTIVFRVSGLIQLQSQCIIGNGYVTIAGQTAPGEGICIANWRAGMMSPTDVIMRYMRFRVGDGAQQSMDAMSLGSATHTIVDHISSSWSLDVACNSLQTSKVGSQLAMTSYQHNIISEPLRYSYHYNDSERSATGCTNCYQPHAFGASIGGEIGSYHHNLITHSTDRNWSLAGGLDQSSHYGGSLDVRNNVVYNWTARTTDGGVARLNYVNNYYKPYAANNPVSWLLKLDAINTNWGTEYYYMAGNVMEGKTYLTNNWMSGSFYNGLPLAGLVVSNAELYPSYVTTQTATNAYKMVLSDSGCTLPAQDFIDRRVIGEVLDGTLHYKGTNGATYTIGGVLQDTRGADTPGMIDSQTDVHDYQSTNSAAANYSPNAPWGPYRTYHVPQDSDHDGLPDWWERLKGLNPNSAAGDYSDANADLLGDGYTELERYLNWLAQPHFDCTNGSALRVELTQYTRGFTNLSPTYAVFGAANGTVALSSKTAVFTATASTNALGSFMFSVTDSSGFSYTNTVNVHILAQGEVDNSAPVMVPIANRALNAGANLVLSNLASDADIPVQALTYTLLAGPANSTLDPTNGIFCWRPLVSQANSTNTVIVAVADDGTPSLSATQSFAVTVNALQLPTLTSPQLSNGQIGLSVTGQVGPDYAVQTSTNLVDWSTLLITNPAAMPFNWTTNGGALPMQFFRVKVGPPLP